MPFNSYGMLPPLPVPDSPIGTHFLQFRVSYISDEISNYRNHASTKAIIIVTVFLLRVHIYMH